VSDMVVMLTTLLLGIVPLGIFSALSGTVWFTARCDVPLLAVPSVWLGDSLFLPLVNVGVYRFLQYLRSRPNGMPSGSSQVYAVTGALVLSIAGLGYLHYTWTQDAYLGFIDSVPGHLAPAGWWHLGFSVAESTIVIVFLYLWCRSRRVLQFEWAARGLAVWRPFIVYSALSLLDFAISHVFILPRHPQVPYSLFTNWQGLMILPFSITVYLVAKIGAPREVAARKTLRASPTPAPRTEDSDPKRTELLLQLHIAEYQALTTRGTNWLALESGIWVLMVLFLAVLPPIWNFAPHDLLIWGGFGVLVMMLFVWSNMTYEHYNSVRYIERELRSMITALLGPARFWQYESYIKPTRPKTQPLWFEAAPAFANFVVLGGIAIYRYPQHQGREYWEFGVDFLLCSLYAWFTSRMVQVRRHLTASDESSVYED
jgi:hypothetical protein